MIALLDMGMENERCARVDQLRQLRLECGAAHLVGVLIHFAGDFIVHRRSSCLVFARKASRSFSRALCNCDLLLPSEQSSIAAISLCSYPLISCRIKTSRQRGRTVGM